MLLLVANGNLDTHSERAFPHRSVTWLSGDPGRPQGNEELRPISCYLPEVVDVVPGGCRRWMQEQRTKSLGGLTAEILAEQELGLLAVHFLFEILTGKRR